MKFKEFYEGKVAPSVQRSSVGRAKNPTTGVFVKKAGELDIYKRTRGDKDFYDFIEAPHKEHKVIRRDEPQPLIYTYSPGLGNLTYGGGGRWARQEILTNSPGGRKAGRKPALPDDLEGAIKVAQGHYAKYKPQ